MSEDNFIKTWRFEDAPEKYKSLSDNGGDEDWISLVPNSMKEKYYIGWLEEGCSSSYGCCCIDWYEHKDGWVVIGAHS